MKKNKSSSFWELIARSILRNRILILTIVVSITFFWANQWKSSQKIASFVVMGNTFVPREEVLEAANVSTASVSIGDINLHEIEQNLQLKIKLNIIL